MIHVLSSQLRSYKVQVISYILLVASLVAPATFTAQTEESGGAVSRVKALETLWNQAEVDKDARALGQMVPETFTYVDIDGSLKTKNEFLDSLKTAFEQPSEVRNESMIAHAYGNTVVVTGVYREKGTANGKSYSRRGRFTDTWVSEKSSWQCVASQLTVIEK